MALLQKFSNEHPLASFRNRMDRLFEDLLGDSFSGETSLALPVVDIAERDDEVEVHAELAGVKPEDVSVTAEDGVITIKGEKNISREQKDTDWLLTERSYGSFTRVLQLPSPVDIGKAKASYKDGVLTVTIPKKPEAQPRKIDIKVD